MSTQYAREDEDIDLNDPVLVGDLSDQTVSDVIDPARKVPFIIKKASVRKQYADANDKSSTVEVTRLSIDAAIGADGVDTEGKYANKHIFCDLVLAFNKETHTGEWWEKRSRGPTKQFFQALGYDVANLPPIDADLLGELGGKEFVADILRKPIQNKTDQLNPTTGKAIYANSGDYKNELANFRAATE